MIDFNNIMNRTNNGSMKWDIQYIETRFGKITTPQIYPLFIADMDYVIDTKISHEFQKIIATGDFGYFHIQASFFTSIQNWYQNEHQLIIPQEDIHPASGTLSAIHYLMASIGKDKPTLTFTPGYGHFQQAITPFAPLHTMTLVEKSNRYFIDFPLLEKIILEENIQVIVICNPHNPSGRNWNKDELLELVNLCKKHDIYIISDEIHGDLSLEKNKFTSLYTYANIHDKIVVTSSGNKLFNISGLATSYILSRNNHILQKFSKKLNQYHASPNRLGIEYATIAYNNGHDWKVALQKQLSKNIEQCKKILTSDKLTIWEPDAGYLIWIKLNSIDHIDEFVQQLAQQTGVLVETGTRFIEQETTFIRINVATKKALLEEALHLLNDFIEKY